MDITREKNTLWGNEHPIFKDPNVANNLSHLHDKYAGDKTPNNIVFACK
jgi:hypothetical protein